MNIRQAKDYIKDSVKLYLKKNEFGEYRIPVVRQRPIFLLGAPGIGKTAIMEQVAEELGIALVAYSMTHHTRQSALGLPFIRRKEYGGEEVDVSEYTMSEIIASVYETMENSGIREGILFLDEINCVSETLAPSMLQFLQYKVFGRHQVPEGWVIVTAGNPPEYNKSVREFDIVTMDRLKILEVEADYEIWRAYARERGLHNAILNFLDLKKDYFYRIETTVKGKAYVTARGWEDLSEILQLYEEEGLSVDETLIGQYVRHEKIVREFAAYYDLYNKYKKDYRVSEILAGQIDEKTVERAKNAPFDERLSLLGMLIDKVSGDMREQMECADFLTELLAPLKALKAAAMKEGTDAGKVMTMLETQAQAREKQMENLQSAGALSEADKRKNKRILRFLTESAKGLYMGEATDGQQAFGFVKQKYDSLVAQMKVENDRTSARLHYLFAFAEAAFTEGNEMLILVTELTVDNACARFISAFGSEDYRRHNQELMLTERQADIKKEIAALEL